MAEAGLLVHGLHLAVKRWPAGGQPEFLNV